MNTNNESAEKKISFFIAVLFKCYSDTIALFQRITKPIDIAKDPRIQGIAATGTIIDTVISEPITHTAMTVKMMRQLIFD